MCPPVSAFVNILRISQALQNITSSNYFRRMQAVQKQVEDISVLVKHAVQGSDADAVDYTSSLSEVIGSVYDGDDSKLNDAFHRLKLTKQ